MEDAKFTMWVGSQMDQIIFHSLTSIIEDEAWVLGKGIIFDQHV